MYYKGFLHNIDVQSLIPFSYSFSTHKYIRQIWCFLRFLHLTFCYEITITVWRRGVSSSLSVRVGLPKYELPKISQHKGKRTIYCSSVIAMLIGNVWKRRERKKIEMSITGLGFFFEVGGHNRRLKRYSIMHMIILFIH